MGELAIEDEIEVEVEETQASDGATAETTGAKVERSKIKFPYTDIDDAVMIASTIKDKHGAGPMGLDQLAGAVGGSSVKSGAFRTKLATASTFGAIKTGRGHVELTDLGHRLAGEETRGDALVEAFLKVPLYQRIYDEYKNMDLPGDQGLEATIRRYGVVPSQADRARQAFQRSAQKAGFFWSGRKRLVRPLGPTLAPAPATSSSEESTGVGTVGEEDVMSNALLAALFKKMLPAEGEPFTAKERKRFFRALAVNLDVVYGEPEDGELDAEALAALFKVQASSSNEAASV